MHPSYVPSCVISFSMMSHKTFVAHVQVLGGGVRVGKGKSFSPHPRFMRTTLSVSNKR